MPAATAAPSHDNQTCVQPLLHVSEDSWSAAVLGGFALTALIMLICRFLPLFILFPLLDCASPLFILVLASGIEPSLLPVTEALPGPLKLGLC